MTNKENDKKVEQALSMFTEKMESLEKKLMNLLQANGVTEEMIEQANNTTETTPVTMAMEKLNGLVESLYNSVDKKAEGSPAGGDEEE